MVRRRVLQKLAAFCGSIQDFNHLHVGSWAEPPARAFHALQHNADCPPTEAYVPLFAITSLPEFERRLQKGAEGGIGRFSHFELFPTLLLAMGYDAGWVSRAYGPSLMDSPARDRKFMIGSPELHPMMISVDR